MQDNLIKSPLMAEFCGIMAGDGCLSNTGKGINSGNKYWIYICGHRFDDKEHYFYIKKIIKQLFKKEVSIKERVKENVNVIRFSDKKIFNIIKSLGIPIGEKYEKLHMPYWITKNKDNTILFLRGLFDTDGSFVLSKQHKIIPYYPRIEISTKSKRLAKQVKENLNKIKIGCSLNKKRQYFRLEVAGKERCKLWMDIIGTKNKKHFIKYKNSIKSKDS
jgi:hypothetical protein